MGRGWVKNGPTRKGPWGEGGGRKTPLFSGPSGAVPASGRGSKGRGARKVRPALRGQQSPLTPATPTTGRVPRRGREAGLGRGLGTAARPRARPARSSRLRSAKSKSVSSSGWAFFA